MSKVLIIDDEESIRKVLGVYLRSKDYEVLTAPDGQEGIEVFQKERPPIVLTDIRMPGMDGIEVLERIKQFAPETEVIVVTGHGDMDLAIKALQLDASDFITKPVGNEALSIALKRAQERLDTRRMLKASHEYLRQAEKLMAIGKISDKLAHEIRNPLTVIGGLTDRLKKKARQCLGGEKYPEIMSHEIARLENLVNDILLYSGEVPLNKTEVNINKVINEVLLLFDRELGEKGISVRTFFGENIQLIRGDKEKLQEVFINIMINAVHSMEKGGNLMAQTEGLCERAPKSVKAVISDTGKGIPEDILDKVFDPFFTTKTVGSGLGLSVAREIIKRHNGTMAIHSEVGKGTTIIVEL
ncbi:MAG: response regulator [Thermodesulfobacteriota bacterium]|nr:response regulator [Thermodesulfobacteriota bacterium]